MSLYKLDFKNYYNNKSNIVHIPSIDANNRPSFVIMSGKSTDNNYINNNQNKEVKKENKTKGYQWSNKYTTKDNILNYENNNYKNNQNGMDY